MADQLLVYSVKGDIRNIEQHLTRLARDQVPFATALALTRTAQFIQGEIKKEITRAFDRPTKFTQDSTYVRPATKQRLWAEVKIKDESFKAVPPIKWLAPQIYGGTRALKRFEQRLVTAGAMPSGYFAVPASGADMDSFGNMSKGEIVRMLSDLQAHWDTRQNTTARSRKRRRASKSVRPVFYFSTWPVNKRTAHLKPGIYKRVGAVAGLASGISAGFKTPIKPVFLFVKRVRYRKRLRFFEIAEQTGRMRFPIEFALAMRQALKTARPAGAGFRMAA